jgi:outer membrane protein
MVMPPLSKTSMSLSLLALLLAGLTASPARAADHEGADRAADEEAGAKWGLGVGASLKKSPYKGMANDNSYLPLVSYENKWVRLFANTLDAKLPSLGDLDFSIRAKVALGEGYRASKSPYLAGMDSRNGSVYLGAAGTWRAGFAKLSLDYLEDVSGNSKGGQLKFGVERSFDFERALQVTPHASITRLDSKYVDYYYGVKASEATPARQEYIGKSTAETEFGVRFGYLVAPNQRVLLDISDAHRGAGISRSPLVDKSSTPAFQLGYIHAF